MILFIDLTDRTKYKNQLSLVEKNRVSKCEFPKVSLPVMEDGNKLKTDCCRPEFNSLCPRGCFQQQERNVGSFEMQLSLEGLVGRCNYKDSRSIHSPTNIIYSRLFPDLQKS